MTSDISLQTGADLSLQVPDAHHPGLCSYDSHFLHREPGECDKTQLCWGISPPLSPVADEVESLEAQRDQVCIL